MAGCWTPNQNYSKQGNSAESLEKLKQETKFLTTKLKDLRRQVADDREIVQKLRNNNSDLFQEQNPVKVSGDNKKDLLETIENYKNIIRRLQRDSSGYKHLQQITKTNDQRIEFCEKKENALIKDRSNWESRLKKVYEVINTLRESNFEDDEANSELRQLFIETEVESIVKREPSSILDFGIGNYSSIEVKREKNSKKDIFLPLYDYSKPQREKINNMHSLNKCIEKFLKASNHSVKSECQKLISQTFNRAQSSVFLYDQTAQFVTLMESENDGVGSVRFSFTDARDYEEGSVEAPFVVEKDWKSVIDEYKKLLNELPKFLMLLVREKGEHGLKYVMFVLDFQQESVLRYDPLAETIKSKEYRRVFGEIFKNYTHFNFWQKRHLDEESNGISWLYCIEFARRIAMKLEEEGPGYISKSIMRGKHDGYRPFVSIDFDLDD